MAHLMGVPPRQAVRALRSRKGIAGGRISDAEDVEDSGGGQAHLLDRQAHLEVLLKPAQELERDWEELLDILPGMRREELAALVAVTVRYRGGGQAHTTLALYAPLTPSLPPISAPPAELGTGRASRQVGAIAGPGR